MGAVRFRWIHKRLWNKVFLSDIRVPQHPPYQRCDPNLPLPPLCARSAIRQVGDTDGNASIGGVSVASRGSSERRCTGTGEPPKRHSCPPGQSPGALSISRSFWIALGGDRTGLERLRLAGEGKVPSSFPVMDFASGSFAAAAVSIAEFATEADDGPTVAVDRRP